MIGAKTSHLALLIVAPLMTLSASNEASGPPTETSAEAPGTASTALERPDLPFPPGVDPVSVCGFVDDLQHVELYDGSLGISRQYVRDYEPTTVQLRWISQQQMRERLPTHILGNVSGAKWCTGTLIGPTTVLTAGHCFDVQQGQAGWTSPWQRSANGSVEYLRPEELAKLQVVTFNYQVNAQSRLERPGVSFPIVRLIEYREGAVGGKLDYAIVEIGANDQSRLPVDLGYHPALLAGAPAAVNATLGIIQHPQGDPKKVEAGRLLRYEGSQVYYNDIDTYGGSSGSGIRDSQGAVIGVHTNGGCDAPGGANRGVSIGAIRNVSDRL